MPPSLAQPTVEPTACLDADTIEKASALNVFDVNGQKTSFGSMFEEQKTIVVFIRASIYFVPSRRQRQ
jgi:hypothetical protein